MLYFCHPGSFQGRKGPRQEDSQENQGHGQRWKKEGMVTLCTEILCLNVTHCSNFIHIAFKFPVCIEKKKKKRKV